MIRYLLVLPAVIIGIIIAISLYLQPNDFAFCADTPTDSAPCTITDAIVVISGGDTNARTDEAVKLYNNGWAPMLILSGAAEDKSGPSNAAAMEARAVSMGVPHSAIYLDEASETTKQNAENVKSIFSAQNINSIILVTSGYHQKRASLEFHKMATGVTIKNHPVTTDKDWSFWWWSNPRGWTLAVTELFKIVVFHLGASS